MTSSIISAIDRLMAAEYAAEHALVTQIMSTDDTCESWSIMLAALAII